MAAILPRMSDARRPAPRILVTVADPARQDEPAIAARKNELYVESVIRHGGRAVVLDHLPTFVGVEDSSLRI